MAANWNLAGSFLGGASLADRIAGRENEQDIQRRSLNQRTALEDAEFAAKNGMSPDEMIAGATDSSSPSWDAVQKLKSQISGMRQASLDEAANKSDLTSAQTDEAMARGDYYKDMGDYIAGRNDTALGVAGIRAGAMKDIANLKLGGKGPFSTQETQAWGALLKAREMDPDGSQGIFGQNEQALYMDGLRRLNSAGGGAPLPSSSAVSPKPQGMFGSMVSGIAGLAGKIAGQGDGSAPAGVAPGAMPGAAPQTPAGPPPWMPQGTMRVKIKGTNNTGWVAPDDYKKSQDQYELIQQ